MNRNRIATEHRSLNEMLHQSKPPKPWYQNLNTWVGIIIGAALIGTILLVALILLFVLRGQTTSDTAATQSTGTGSVVVVDTPPPGGMGSTAGSAVVLPDSWEGQERFTILMMGIDRRPGEIGTGFRTDTMILISIDPATNSLGMLSIPRDLYVEIPGYGRHRVNEAMPLGELQQLDYGPPLAMQTIQYNFGIRVHDYLVADFNAFIRIVDEIGGIDIDVPYEIYDPLYPDQNFGYDPFYIAAGPQHLDGAAALKYARTRHTSGNDFDRARRQQQVIYAIRDKILEPGNWPKLITKAPAIWQEINTGVHTGLDFNTMLQLAMYLKDIPGENIHSGIVDQRYASDYTTPAGEMVLIPIQSALGGLMAEVFGVTYNQ